MSKTAVRHEALLLLLSARGYVSIDELAAHFDVTAQTVRKDINALAREGKVVRFHGGAEGFIREFKADYGILGVPCIDEDGNLLEQDLHRAAVAKAIIESSRFVFLAVAASCFGSSAVARVAHLSSIQAVFSNAPLDDRWKKLADAAGTPLHLV